MSVQHQAVVLFLVFIGTVGGTSPISHEKATTNLTVIFLSENEEHPGGAVMFVIFSNGIIRDLLGHEVDDSLITKILHFNPDPTKPAPGRQVVLGFAEPDTTSVARVKEMLQRFKTRADPNRKTTIFVKGVTP